MNKQWLPFVLLPSLVSLIHNENTMPITPMYPMDSLKKSGIQSYVDAIQSANNSKGPTPDPAIPATPTTPPVVDQYPVAPPPVVDAPAVAGTSDLENKQLAAISAYANSLNTNPSDIVEKMRLKTGGVSDIDNRLDALRAEQAAVRPKLMAQYANLDPAQREALIAGEEQRIANETARYTNLRTSRLGTINDMINAEIKDKENKLQGQQALVQLYGQVIGDKRQADQAQKQLDQMAVQLELLRGQAKQTAIQTEVMAQQSGITIPEDTWTGKPFVERPAGSVNVGKDLNNPGNITADISSGGKTILRPDVKEWAAKNYPTAIGVQQSPNGRFYLVFPSAEAGKASMAGLVTNKNAYPDSMTIAEFARKYSGGDNPGYVNTLVAATGKPATATLGQVDRNLLVQGVHTQEGSGALADSPAVANYLSKKNTTAPFDADAYIKKLKTSNNPDLELSRLNSVQADAVIQSPAAESISEAYIKSIIAKASPAVANAYADQANVNEMQKAVVADDPDKIATAIVELFQKKAPASKIKSILKDAGFSFGGNYLPISNTSEQVADKIRKVKGLESLAAEMD